MAARRIMERGLLQTKAKRSKKGADGVESPAGKGKRKQKTFVAPFGGAQARVKSKLGIQRKVSKEAYLTKGRFLEELSTTVATTCGKIVGSSDPEQQDNKRVSQKTVYHTVMMLTPAVLRPALRDHLHRTLRVFHENAARKDV